MTYKADHSGAMLTGAYMTMGFILTVAKHPPKVMERPSDGLGQTGVVDELLNYADLSEALLEALNPGDYPGVYEYEVSEPFGEWYAKHCITEQELPSHADAKKALIEIIVRFFCPSDADVSDRKYLTDKLSAVKEGKVTL